MIVFLFFSTWAWASSPLQELKKVDYSILLKEPPTERDREGRCFFLPEVNQALVRVQQRLRLLQSGLKVTQCYTPSHALFGAGVALKAELTKEGQTGKNALKSSLAAEGFSPIKKSKGAFIYEKQKNAVVQTTPVSDLP